MKVLVIIGSPHKGASYSVVKRIEKMMPSSSFEYVFVKELKLRMCEGCFACLSKGENFCPIKGDRIKILKKMHEAEGVIFASPNYVISISSLMKCFIERFAYLSHRPEFYGKPALVVVTSTGPYMMKEILRSLARPVESWGFFVVDSVGIAKHPILTSTSLVEKRTEKRLAKAAKRFQRPSKKTPELWRIMQFEAMKAHAMMFPKAVPADYHYYKDKEFFSDMKIHWIKKFAAYLFRKMIRLSLKKHFLEF
jgi:multimeric flavodoxin WrbA